MTSVAPSKICIGNRSYREILLGELYRRYENQVESKFEGMTFTSVVGVVGTKCMLKKIRDGILSPADPGRYHGSLVRNRFVCV